jgi:hypothetical protein
VSALSILNKTMVRLAEAAHSGCCAQLRDRRSAGDSTQFETVDVASIGARRTVSNSRRVNRVREDGSLLVAMFVVVVMSIVVLFALLLMFVTFFTALFVTFFIARLMPWFNCNSPVAARCDDTQSDREHNAFNVLARATSRM